MTFKRKRGCHMQIIFFTPLFLIPNLYITRRKCTILRAGFYYKAMQLKIVRKDNNKPSRYGNLHTKSAIFILHIRIISRIMKQNQKICELFFFMSPMAFSGSFSKTHKDLVGWLNRVCFARGFN